MHIAVRAHGGRRDSVGYNGAALMARLRGILTLLVLLFPIFMLSAFAEGGVSAKYDFEITLLADSQALYVRQSTQITNNTGASLGRAVFSVYANAFRRESTLPYDNITLEKAFPDYYAPSGIDIISVTVNGERADWGIQGADEAFLRVECKLDDGETAEISFTYTVLLSDNHAFLGAGDYDWRLVYFYPSLCPFQNGDYVTNSLTRAGRSHFAEAADFDVKLYLPPDYYPACAGIASEKEASGGYTEYTTTLKNARDIAMCVSRKYHMYEAETKSGVHLRILGRDRGLMKRVQSAAEFALNELEALFGAYPRGEIVIAQSQSCVDEICASGLTVLGEGASELSNDELRLLVYRAMAKQYLTDIVHPNPSYDAWLTDGLCEYMSLMLVYSNGGKQEFLKHMNARIAPSLNMTIPGGLYPNSDVARINTIADYDTLVRFRSSAVLDELRRVMGRDDFLKAVSDYYTANAFKTPTANDFIDALNRHHETTLGDALVAHIYTIDENVWEHFEYTE